MRGEPSPETAPSFDTKGYQLKDEEVERHLLSGKLAPELELYFGEREYRELRDLARQANLRTVRGGPRVLILPGIMGSKLGRRGKLSIFDDVYWFDPMDVVLGNLRRLTLDRANGNVEALGVFLTAYLKLKLRLKIAGYDADFYPFDWRRSIQGEGDRLAKFIQADPSATVSLVAHSMGGLVARSALRTAAASRKVSRLVMLGTPNYGSFSPVQALRGSHATVLKIAKIARSTPEELTRGIFASFPGLYEMLPSPLRYDRGNFFESAAWPGAGLLPRPAVLKAAADVQDFLARPDGRFFLIAGVNQSTVVGARVENGELAYEESNDGDGTVPLAFARVDGAKTYYVEESHGSLPNNRLVERAVVDILAGGSTDVLPDAAPAGGTRSAVVRRVSEEDLRQFDPYPGRRGAEIGPREARHAAEEFVAPGARDEAPIPVLPGAPILERDGAEGGEAFDGFDGVVVGRRRQHRLDIQLAHGSITDVEARAYVVGVYQEVAPSGAANAIDRLMGGAITDFTRRRMFSGDTGEVFMLPAGRNQIRAELVLMAGLGRFDQFDAQVQALVAENILRTFLRTRVEDFATVVPGGGSGQSVQRNLYNMVAGFVRGLVDADTSHHFRSVTICETDAARYDQIRAELFRLTGTRLCEDVEITLTDLKVVPSAAVMLPERAGRPEARRPDPVYLLVETQKSGRQESLRAAVLTAGRTAQIIPRSKPIDAKKVDALLAELERTDLGQKDVDELGDRLKDLILDGELAGELAAASKRHLVIVHDRDASRYPWETLRVDGWSPAAGAGLSHRFLAQSRSVAKFSDRRRRDEFLDVLLVVNPTSDLPGAEEEGKRVREMFGRGSTVRVTQLLRGEATKQHVLQEFRSGKFDVLHYAGHAFFDARNPGSAGLLCAGKEVLSGPDLVGISSLPSLVFFNACEAARVRRVGVRKQLQTSSSVAEVLLRSGVANFLGTYWPVGDAAAADFSQTLYGELLAGKTLAEAITAGRKKVQDAGSIDWADYIHYGSYDFVLKDATAGGNGRAG